MNQVPELPARIKRAATGDGFAVASLVLGLLALLGSPCMMGLILGPIGLILGLNHLRRPSEQRGLATAGIASSGAAILVSLIGLIAMLAIGNRLGGADSEFERWKGVRAPELTLTTIDGESITLSELRGRRVVIDIWATWCPPCREEIPHFVELSSQYGPDTLLIVGISGEDEDTLRDFVEDHRVNYPIAQGDSLPSPFGDVSSIPTTFFIDRNGVIDAVLVGYHDLETLRRRATAEDYSGNAHDEPIAKRGSRAGSSGAP